MKTQKRYVIIGIIVLFITLIVGFGFVVANGPGRFCDRGFDHGFHARGFHHGFDGEHFPEHVLSHMDDGAGLLDLSDAQKEKYGEIRAKIKDRLTEGMEDRKRLMDELRTEINRENPDINLLTDLIKKRIKGISRLMDENLDLFVELYDILDEDQKGRLIERFREKIGKSEA